VGVELKLTHRSRGRQSHRRGHTRERASRSSGEDVHRELARVCVVLIVEGVVVGGRLARTERPVGELDHESGELT
jgi:hypothetical protein